MGFNKKAAKARMNNKGTKKVSEKTSVQEVSKNEVIKKGTQEVDTKIDKTPEVKATVNKTVKLEQTKKKANKPINSSGEVESVVDKTIELSKKPQNEIVEEKISILPLAKLEEYENNPRNAQYIQDVLEETVGGLVDSYVSSGNIQDITVVYIKDKKTYYISDGHVRKHALSRLFAMSDVEFEAEYGKNKKEALGEDLYEGRVEVKVLREFPTYNTEAKLFLSSVVSQTNQKELLTPLQELYNVADFVELHNELGLQKTKDGELVSWDIKNPKLYQAYGIKSTKADELSNMLNMFRWSELENWENYKDQNEYDEKKYSSDSEYRVKVDEEFRLYHITHPYNKARLKIQANKPENHINRKDIKIFSGIEKRTGRIGLGKDFVGKITDEGLGKDGIKGMVDFVSDDNSMDSLDGIPNSTLVDMAAQKGKAAEKEALQEKKEKSGSASANPITNRNKQVKNFEKIITKLNSLPQNLRKEVTNLSKADKQNIKSLWGHLTEIVEELETVIQDI